MPPRLPMLAAALTLALSAPQAASALAPQEDARAFGLARAGDGAERALRALKADASGAVRVQRDADGDVAFVSSTDGRSMLASDATSARRSAQQQLAHYGEAFGIDGTTSKAVVRQTLDSATGGSVVRAEQVVDGVPVFGGQLVMSLDQDQGVVSVSSATTEAVQVPAAVVDEAQARRTALSVAAKSHRVDASGLTVSSAGRRLYDPALVHTTDPLGTRPVWQLEVTNGSDIRETVLVGTDRGEVALHFNDAPGINRRICDNTGLRVHSSSNAVPVCVTPARREGEPAVPLLTDVNQAYDNLGATSETYDQLAGIDLTQLIGATVSGSKVLQSTVRWCFSETNTSCPYDNAFWDGTQMVFGQGYAAADDVVAHELTHGYVERTSGLFAFHQSGALNESLADVIGEVVDHRYGADDDSAWRLGEDVPVIGALRSLKDPPLFNQPDRMTSPKFVTADIFFDSGAVHDNDGVGNKTAYLISQGGTFNGHTITGIDAGDATLAKTGRLYLEVIARLTSGSQYADLGRTLVATCEEFAGAAFAGFTSADCAAVRASVAATELSLPPTNPEAAHAEAPAGCAVGARQEDVRRDDDDIRELGFTSNGLWQRTPDNNTPTYARSGDGSWFAWDPDPSLDGISTSQIVSSSFVVPTGQPSYLRFDHAYVFEWYDAFGGNPAFYPDGGQVLVQTLSGGTWTTRTVTWDNGPDKPLNGTSATAFGGDSHGYGSSRVDLTTLAGQTARVIFKVTGDQDTYAVGWWVDDVRVHTCPHAVASVPATTVAAGTTTALVSWTAPQYVGSSPVASYRITRSDGKVNTAPGSSRSLNLTGLAANTAVTVAVAAVAENGQVGAASAVPLYGTSTTVTAPARVRRAQTFTVTAKVVRRGTSSVVSGMPVTLQRRVKGSTLWRTVSSSTTSAAGIRSWSVRQSSVTSYRLVSKGVRTYLGTTSALRTVSMR